MNVPINKFTIFMVQKFLPILFKKEKSTKELNITKMSIPTSDGKNIRAILYCPKDLVEKSSCLVYFHGGGFVFPAAPYHFRLAKQYALKAHCKVLFVDYRLARKHPFPTAMEDCYCAYNWAVDNANSLNIDTSKIAVAGDSAGGQLATQVCIKAKENNQTMPCCQMLIYPVVCNGDTESKKTFTDTPMCNSKAAEKFDKLYYQNKFNAEKVLLMENENLTGMPNTYIETAEFDCLRDGGIIYAEKLKKHGVDVLLYNTKGTMHGFDMVSNSQIVRECVENRIKFLENNL